MWPIYSIYCQRAGLLMCVSVCACVTVGGVHAYVHIYANQQQKVQFTSKLACSVSASAFVSHSPSHHSQLTGGKLVPIPCCFVVVCSALVLLFRFTAAVLSISCLIFSNIYVYVLPYWVDRHTHIYIHTHTYEYSFM